MDSKAVDEEVQVRTEATEGIESPPTNENTNTSSLPTEATKRTESPPTNENTNTSSLPTGATKRTESPPTNENTNTSSLPSLPDPAKATNFDSARNENGLHSGQALGGELSVSGSPAGAHEEVSAADTVNEERLSVQMSDDLEAEGVTRRGYAFATRPKYYDQITRYQSGEENVKKRIKKSSKRAALQMEYIQPVEDRMGDLEKRLRLIEGNGVKPESPATPPGKTNHPAGFTILDIKRMTFQEYLSVNLYPELKSKKPSWNTSTSRHEFPVKSRHLIEVVVGATPQPERQGQYQNTKLLAAPLDLVDSNTSIPAHEPQTNDAQPERIRINSTLLLDALQKITGQVFSHSLNHSQIAYETVLQDQVILRPFKIFVVFEKQIRDEINRLEKMHMHSGNGYYADAPDAPEQEDERPPSLPVNDPFQYLVPEPSGEDSSVSLEGDESQDPKEKGVRDENIPRLESKRCLNQLRVLRELLDRDLKPTFDLRKQIQDGIARNIAFQDLWHLFPLGDEIVSNDASGQKQIYRILNVAGGKPFLCSRHLPGMGQEESTLYARDLPKFEILGYFYAFDGKELGACQQLYTIKSYEGNKAITSLPCFPIIYSKNARGLKPRDFFIERGRRFIELTRMPDVVHKRYDGLTLAMNALREEIDSEVIVDVSMAVLKNNMTVGFGVTQELESDRRGTLEFLDPYCFCQNTPIHKDYEIDQKRSVRMLEDKDFMHDFIESNDELTEEDCLVCPCWVYGYVLRSRKWVKLEVSLVEDIKDHGTGFDSLVLPDGHKETLLALVQSHSRGPKFKNSPKAENRQMDLVRGKGKGLLILLHGEPGVGKSSTAESVAEFTRRPLFQVTCGDIGDSADQVEERLENHFQLAHKWGCVLLLDEADVFLEARSKTDLKRNAIVSVFLRVLEYYSGILFLTTNRVGAFDQAFRSRIHMSLFYPKIDEDATIRIWEMNIERACEIWGGNLTVDDFERKGILKFASRHYKELANSENTWNGRQIRNAFQTAIALAEWDAHQVELKYKSPQKLTPRLTPEHFERVAKASKHFDAYLKETQVGTEADLAMQNRERRDDFPGAER